MRHIPGDIFVNNTGKYGKYFKRGIQYTLKRIVYNEDEKTFKYIFIESNGEKDIVFANAKQADDFLDSFTS